MTRHLPKTSSWIWPAVPIIAPFTLALVVLVALKNKSEIEKRPADAWGSVMRERLLRWMAEDNGLDIATPASVEANQRGVFLPKGTDPRRTASMRFDWTDDNAHPSVAFALDEHGPGGVAFLDAAFADFSHAYTKSR